jgi:hypothetical protein
MRKLVPPKSTPMAKRSCMLKSMAWFNHAPATRSAPQSDQRERPSEKWRAT